MYHISSFIFIFLCYIDIILVKQVGEGVPTADEDENIKEQVVENKSHTDELHTASTRDETNDEVCLTSGQKYYNLFPEKNYLS